MTMTTTTYADFLSTKPKRAVSAGPMIDAGLIHPSLFAHQRHAAAWAIRKGRAALFLDTGLGKSRCAIEWARLISPDRPALIVAPLTVARQFAAEGAEIGVPVRYVRSGDDITGPGVWTTNYEMVEHFDPDALGAVVLDESSILKNVDGRTRQLLTERFVDVPYRLACTATPAPNDVAELANHAEFLGVMSRADMLASYFVHDDDGWRVKGHASERMYQWMASWAMAMRRPSDFGFPDDGYDLPPLSIGSEVVTVDLEADEGSLFATLGGVQGRAKVRKATMAARVTRAVELANADEGQWIVWCGLNDEADQAARAIAGAVNLHGSLDPDTKAGLLTGFLDGEHRVLVTKPSIAGWGLNLQCAHQMVFLGLGDSYEAYYQAIRRCWRFGQHRPVDVHVVVSTLEQEIVANVLRKEAAAARTTSALIAQMHHAQEADQ